MNQIRPPELSWRTDFTLINGHGVVVVMVVVHVAAVDVATVDVATVKTVALNGTLFGGSG